MDEEMRAAFEELRRAMTAGHERVKQRMDLLERSAIR
jgi:hypothetical protein